MKEEIKSAIKNYKTTIPAIIGLTCVGLYLGKVIDGTQLTTAIGVLTSIGLLGAKDHTK
jgi:hypothetical protein